MARIDELLYFVILKKREDFDPPKLADIMSRILGGPRFDVISHLNRYSGFLYKTQDRGRAEELEGKLRKEGMESFVATSLELKGVPAPTILKKALPEQKGLVFEKSGKRKILPWGSFVLVCAGKVEGTVTVKETLPPDGKVGKWILRTGFTPITAIAISGERARKRKKIKKETRIDYYLDLIAKIGFKSVRISGYDFDYSYLGARKQYNLFLNFKNLALDIAKFLPGVCRNRGMFSLENESMMKGFGYDSMDDYDYEKLWLMQLVG